MSEIIPLKNLKTPLEAHAEQVAALEKKAAAKKFRLISNEGDMPHTGTPLLWGDLPSHPGATVFISESPETAAAIRQIFRSSPSVTWEGGERGIDFARWHDLAQMNVVLWPGLDRELQTPLVKALRRAGCVGIDVLDVRALACADPENPQGPPRAMPVAWTAVDAVREWGGERFAEYFATHPAYETLPALPDLCPASILEAVAWLNEQYFLIRLGKKSFIGELGVDDLGNRGVLKLLEKTSFEIMLSNHFAENEKGERKPLTKLWFEHPLRRAYCGLGLDISQPKDMSDGRLNLWQGYGVKPSPGTWSLMKDHIAKELSGGDKEAAKYIFRWLAWVLQNPDKQAEAILVLISAEGTGKSLLFNAIAKCFGVHGQRITQPKHLTGHFNAHLLNTLFLFVDEGFWSGDKAAEGTLRGLVTDSTITIEPKGVDAAEYPNRMSLAFATNNDWAVPASQTSRRYCVIRCSDRTAKNMMPDEDRKAYFDAIVKEMKQGSIEAMLYDLLRLPLGEWHPREIYETAALQDQKARTLRGLDAWWENLLQTGDLPRSTGAAQPGWAPSRELFEDAKAKAPGEYQLTETRLGRFLRDKGCTAHMVGKERIRGWRFPLLSDAREAWAKKCGGWSWYTPEQDRWGNENPHG